MVFYLRTWGEERRGEMHGNSNMETYTTRSKTDRQQEFTYVSGNSNGSSVST